MFLALNASAFFAWIHFSDLAIFWLFSWPLQLFCVGSFSSRFSTWIFLPSYSLLFVSAEVTGPTIETIFSIEVIKVASLLNL